MEHNCRWRQRYFELELMGRQGWSAIRWLSIAMLSIALFQSNIRIEVRWYEGFNLEINHQPYKGISPACTAVLDAKAEKPK